MGELTPWVQSLGVVALGAAGIVVGRWAGRRRWWPAACAAAVAMIAIFGAARWVPWLELVPPFAWLMRGRMEYAMFAPAAAVALLPLVARLPHRRQAVLVQLLMALLVGHYSVMPFLMPALVSGRIAALTTRIDDDGVCRQSTGYTCGPAASVSALRQLGIHAEESQLARLMYTSPALGTPTDVLAAALEQKYGPDGLRCVHRHFNSVDDLPRGEPVLAVVKFAWMVDHFVAVLAVDDDVIVVGDPAAGKVTYTRKQFEQKWRFMGVVLSPSFELSQKKPTDESNTRLTTSY